MSVPIAVGGMASVHLGKLNGPEGFRRTVAIKRMLQSYASNPQARAMLIDEARLSARVSHVNVVQTLDVVDHQDELFLVLEYVHGESLDRLLGRCRELGQPPPVPVVVAVLAGVLRGLHAAHEAKSEDGQPLELVHRDLSPHNILVDVHGVARVLDFGVARARGRLQATQDGQLKGKLAYLAPEQVHGNASRRSDLFAAGVVLWECLAGRQLFQGDSEADLLSKVLLCKVPSLAAVGLNEPALQAVLDRVLDPGPERRFATASQMADALDARGAASASEVAAWVTAMAGAALSRRAQSLEELERLPATAPAPERPAARSKWAAVALVALGALAVAAFWAVRAPSPAVVTAKTLEPPAAVDAGAAPAAIALPAKPPDEPPPPLKVKRIVKGSPPAPSVACNPPFVIDSNGVKRFKVECLR